MASWKKIIVSGSDAELNQLALDTQLTVGSNQQITTDQSTTFLTGSFTGSFSGTFVGTADLPDLTQGEGISPFTYDGSTTATVAVSGAAELSDNTITKWDDTDGKFVNSSLVDNGTVISGTTSIQLSGTDSSLTGSFTGSFIGDGSGLSGLVTTLNITASHDGGETSSEVDLLTQDLTISGDEGIDVSITGQTVTITAETATSSNKGIATFNTDAFVVTSGDVTLANTGSGAVLVINGTTNEVEVSRTDGTVTVGLPDNVTVTQNLTVGGDLIVNGTTTFINTENVFVEDAFIVLASGSIGTTDGGIVVDRGDYTSGSIGFGFDNETDRWGVQNGLNDLSNVLTIGTDGNSAFMGLVFTETAHTTKPTEGEFVQQGAIFSENNGEIWIYS